jgi:hypothetical protein
LHGIEASIHSNSVDAGNSSEVLQIGTKMVQGTVRIPNLSPNCHKLRPVGRRRMIVMRFYYNYRPPVLLKK